LSSSTPLKKQKKEKEKKNGTQYCTEHPMNHFMLHDAAKMGKKNGKRITCCQAVFTVTLINSKFFSQNV